MGYLAATGAYLIVALAIGFIVMVVWLFVGHIIIFDSIALGIISGVCCYHFFLSNIKLFSERFLLGAFRDLRNLRAGFDAGLDTDNQFGRRHAVAL